MGSMISKINQMGKKWARTGKNQASSSSPEHTFSAENFSGIVRIHIPEAKLVARGKWFACVSIGEQAFRSSTSTYTDNPRWNSEQKIVLERNGPRIARVSVFEVHLLSENVLHGYSEVDLTDTLSQDEVVPKTFILYDPHMRSKIVGDITVSCRLQTRKETEQSFARRLLAIVDYDASGDVSVEEFQDLMKAFGNQMSEAQLADVFFHADENGDGRVSADELAELLAIHKERTVLVKQCPICGEQLGDKDSLNDMIHMSLCFDEGTGSEVMRGGFLTEKQASYGWMFQFSEWANLSTYDAGMKKGTNVAHILVFDRKYKRLIEELINRKIALTMRAIYQSKFGLALLDAGTRRLLVNMTERQGQKMNSPESAEEIPRFIKFFHDRIDVDEFKYPVEHYKTFNEFFVRELKPGTRPIAEPDNDAVAVCAADCRLMVFENVDAATRLWIKGRKFSIAGLLGDDELGKRFEGGAIVIFRLAPQDYHRFHTPITGKIGPFREIPGHLYTVNPIAVNSRYCNVFTDNKRVRSIISSEEFGEVAFVAVGATMVGTITFTRKEGDLLKKGDEFGYFSFGGSTCICVFREGAIDLDKDLLANSERSLETLVSVGMTLGVSKRLVHDVAYSLKRPTAGGDSILSLDNDIARNGIQASSSFNVNKSQLGTDEIPLEAIKEEDAKELGS